MNAWVLFWNYDFQVAVFFKIFKVKFLNFKSQVVCGNNNNKKNYDLKCCAYALSPICWEIIKLYFCFIDTKSHVAKVRLPQIWNCDASKNLIMIFLRISGSTMIMLFPPKNEKKIMYKRVNRQQLMIGEFALSARLISTANNSYFLFRIWGRKD